MRESTPIPVTRFNYGNKVPVDISIHWFKLNEDGSPEGWYYFENSEWIKY